MRPMFTTEIGKMRAQEMIARAERYRLEQSVRASTKEEKPEHERRRARTATWRRVLGVATTCLVLLVLLSGTAGAVPTGGEGVSGGVYEVVPSAPVAPPATPPILIATIVTVAVALGAAA